MFLHGCNPTTYLGKYKDGPCDGCDKMKKVTGHKVYLDNGWEHIRLMCNKCFKEGRLKKAKVFIGGLNEIHKT